MLFLLVVPFIVALLLPANVNRYIDFRDAAAVGLALLFIFTGMGHFIQTEAMSQMLPPWVSERILIVQLTGILEFVIAAGFIVRRSRRLTGYIAAAILVLFFPVNIYEVINHIPIGGHAWEPVYLFIRAPLQLIILFWVYWFAIRRPNPAEWKDFPRLTRPSNLPKAAS